jgi:hypothetical protein
MRKAKGRPPMEGENEFAENIQSSYPDARMEYVILYILIVCKFRIRFEFSQR